LFASNLCTRDGRFIFRFSALMNSHAYNPIHATMALPADVLADGIDWMIERHDTAQPSSARSLARMARQKDSPNRQQPRRTQRQRKAASR
jgi:hypothetical protein